jgi:hypothetical protein
MVALKLVILGVLACAIWQFIIWVSTKVWKYHQEHDLVLITGQLLINIGNWIIRKRGSLMFNWSVTVPPVSPFSAAA